MTTPRVSVLITAYNRESYIRDAIDSVLGQTFTDMEVIIVDDRSSDETLTAINEYRNHDRVRIVANTTNLGQFKNRNLAASLATGEYLKYVDSDDRIAANCLEVMIAAMDESPDAGVGLCKPGRKGCSRPITLDPLTAYRESLLGSGLLNNAPTSTIYRRRLFQRCGGFPELGIIADTLLLYQIAAISPVVILPATLTWYRFHDSQVPIQTDGINRHMVEPVRYLPAIIYNDSCPLPTGERHIAYANLVGNLIRYGVRLAMRGHLLGAIRSWHAADLHLKDIRFAAVRLRLPYSAISPSIGALGLSS